MVGCHFILDSNRSVKPKGRPRPGSWFFGLRGLETGWGFGLTARKVGVAKIFSVLLVLEGKGFAATFCLGGSVCECGIAIYVALLIRTTDEDR